MFNKGPLFQGLLLSLSLGQTSLITVTLAVSPDMTPETFFHTVQQVVPPTVTTLTGNRNLIASPQHTLSHFIIITALGDDWYRSHFMDKEIEACGG